MNRFFFKSQLTIDTILSFFGLFIGLFLALVCYIFNFGFIDLGLTLFLSCFVYLIIKSKSFCQLNIPTILSRRAVLILNIVFIILSPILIYEMYLNNLAGLFLLIILILIFLISLELMSNISYNSYNIYLILFKILIISLILRGNNFFQYPSYIGVDPWYHSLIISDIIKFGYLPINYSYINYPIMHLLISINCLITDETIKNSMFFTVGISEIISLVFIFLIGRLVSSAKTGILATILIAVSGYHISWGYQIIPMSLGLIFFTILIYLIFRGSFSIKFKIISLLFIFLTILTHTITTSILLITVTIYYLTEKISLRLKKHESNTSFVSIFIVLIILTSTMAYWMYTTGFIGYFGLSIKSALMTSDINPIVANSELIDNNERQLNRMQLLLFFAFTIIGSLFCMKEKIVDIRKLIMIVGGGMITLIIFVSIFIGIDSILPDRWYVFIYVILANIAAIGIIYLINSSKNNNYIAYILIIIIILFSIFGITGPEANGGSAIYSKVKVRSALTESELTSYNTLSRFYSGNVQSDGYSSVYFKNMTNLDMSEIIQNKISSEGQWLIVLRVNYLKISPFSVKINQNEKGFGGYVSKYEKVVDTNFEQSYGEKYSKIFDSNSVLGFINNN